MSIALLPSEIARLVLNYLDEEGLKKTHAQFLDECRYLEECKYYFKRGIAVPKTIHGKTLFDYLIVDPEKNVSTNSVESQTDSIKWNSIVMQNVLASQKTIGRPPKSANSLKTTNCVTEVTGSANLYTSAKLTKDTNVVKSSNAGQTLNLKENSANTPNKRKAAGCEKPSQAISIDDDLIIIKSHDNQKKIADQNKSKKPRLLIGKNVEKQPELSVSSLHRQLGSIITDASNLIAQQEEQENQIFNEQCSNQVFDYNIVGNNRTEQIQNNQCNSNSNSRSENNDMLMLDSQVKSTNAVVLSESTNFFQSQQNQQGLLDYLQTSEGIKKWNENVISSQPICLVPLNAPTVNTIDGSFISVVNVNENTTPTQAAQINALESDANSENNNKLKPLKPAETIFNNPKSRDDLFSDIDIIKLRRGPLKQEGPKKKRVYNRVTPLISQLMNKSNENSNSNSNNNQNAQSNSQKQSSHTQEENYIASSLINLQHNLQQDTGKRTEYQEEDLMEILGIHSSDDKSRTNNG